MGKRTILVASVLGAVVLAVLLLRDVGGHEAPSTRAPPTPPPASPSDLGADVDLEALRAELPGNWYWQEGVPTADAAELGRREALAMERNERFGAIQAGLATEAEIRAYYDERRRISADAVELATTAMLRQPLSDRDRGLFELAREMNQRRLEQLPAELERALARKRRQEEARRAWNTQGGQ